MTAWNNEGKFQQACHEAAKRTLKDVQQGLYCKTFLLCFRKGEGDNYDVHTVANGAPKPVVKDDYFTLYGDLLGRLMAVRDAAQKANAVEQANSEERHGQWNKRDAVKMCISNRDKNQYMDVFFVSDPVTVGEWEVFVVLVLNASVYGNFARVETKSHGKYGDRNSFVDCVIEQLLDAMTGALKDRADPDGNGLSLECVQNARLNAARSFVYAVASTCRYRALDGCQDQVLLDEQKVTYNGASNFYAVVSAVSGTLHESQGAHGVMILTAEGHPNVSFLARFEEPVVINEDNVGYIRKLLNLASGNFALVCDSGYVYGVGSITGEYDASDGDIFKVVFEGRGD